MMELAVSYEYCARVARTQARNFYFSFTVLPPEKRAAMCALYAFMRYTDDVSDDEAMRSDRAGQLDRWRKALAGALRGDYGSDPILPAFHNTVRKYGIPETLFEELIAGVEMDLDRNRYETFEDLYRYCYRVASVVGLACIHIWGFEGQGDPNPPAYVPAEACGIAFQLTNILRDVREDGERDRIYLPLQDLRQFGYSEANLAAGVRDERFLRLMQFQAERAKQYYEAALPLIPLIRQDSRPALVIMYRIYRGLLERIERSGYDIFTRRARLPDWKKAAIVAQAWFGGRVPGAGRLLRV